MPATSPKEATLALLQRLAEDASFEQIQYEIYVLEKIAAGLAESAAGHSVSHEEAGAQLAQWLNRANA